MNKDLKTGRLVADLERGETKGGTVVAKGRLAVDGMGGTGKAGFINFESYGPGAEAALKTIGKGWLVAIDGRLQHDQWEQDGQKRQSYKLIGDIEFLAEPRGNGEGRAVAQQAEADKTSETEAEAEADPDLDPAEAIPGGHEADVDQGEELAVA